MTVVSLCPEYERMLVWITYSTSLIPFGHKSMLCCPFLLVSLSVTVWTIFFVCPYKIIM